jgi:hypothetical protein
MTPQKLLMNQLNPSSLLKRGWVLTLIVVGGLVLCPMAQAIEPAAPDVDRGGGNTSDGAGALASLTTGTFNSAFGWDSLLVLSDASFDTAVGAGALLLDNAGTNTAVGTAALLSNTDGSDNNAVGAFALFSNVSGTFNIAVGHAALQSNVDGFQNNAVGDAAMFSNTSGSTNTAIGDDALFNCTTGNSNTALGDEAGTNLADGEGNIYIGAQVNQGGSGEFEFIRIGNDAAFTFPYDTYIAGIFNRDVDSATALFVFVDDQGKLGTNLVNASGNKVATPQAMLNEFGNQQKRIAELEGTVDRLAAMVKDQAAQIQKVSAQLELNKPAPRTVANK